MRAAGICVTVPKQKRPSAHVVVLDDGGTPPTGLSVAGLTVVEDFTLPARPVDIADVLLELLTSVRGRLRGLNVESVTVRRAELPPRPNNKDGPRYRLLAEGATVAAAKEIVAQTQWWNGAQIASACSARSAAAVDAAAATLVGASGDAAVHAASAGLASLLAGRP